MKKSGGKAPKILNLFIRWTSIYRPNTIPDQNDWQGKKKKHPFIHSAC
jgi:hypothetical protein